MTDQQPFEHGRGTRTADGSIVATYPLSASWSGWHIATAELDETGTFLTVRFEMTTEETHHG